MNKIVKRIEEEFSKNPDLVIKDIRLNMFEKVYVVFLETVSGSDKVNDYILKNLISAKDELNKRNISSHLAGPNTVKIDNNDQIEFYLTNGFTCVIYKNVVYAVETKADLTRSIDTANVETSINGPKDAFTENFQTNVGLIKRRIKSSTLKIDKKIVGRKTSTMVGVCYFDDIVDENLVKDIVDRIDKIDIDGITDSSTLSYLIDQENSNVFPTIMQTERPDVVATALLEGKVVLVVDTSPYAIIIPSFFVDFVNPTIDNYSKGINVNFLKILRLVAFVISIVTPAFYIALINYNQESIPTSLLINFATQRDGVPFPAIVEAVIMLGICEILRESDLRFPSNYGSAISILGAIIIGEASVSAGIVSPIMIIVVSITFISSLIINNVEMNNSLRYFRVIFLMSAALLGLYGVCLALIYFFIYITDTYSFNKPYFAPITPYDKEYFKDTVVKGSTKNDTKRSKLFTKKNIVRQKENV